MLTLIFFLLKELVSFEYFLIFFQLSFYSVIFFAGKNFLHLISANKFLLFIVIVIFYPFYQNYSSFLLKQGLGLIFVIISLFIIERRNLYSYIFFALLSIFSHYIFILFHIIFILSRYFSLKILILLFLSSIFIYFLNINDNLFELIYNFLISLNLYFIDENTLNKTYSLAKVQFILFSSLPLFLLVLSNFRKFVNENLLFNNLYKFHFLYSSTIYLFFSEFFYLDRFLSITWHLYPFYFLIMLRSVKF